MSKRKLLQRARAVVIMCFSMTLIVLSNLGSLAAEAAHAETAVPILEHVPSYYEGDPVANHQKFNNPERVVQDEQTVAIPVAEQEKPHLTSWLGVFDGPSGKETYYNLPMAGVVEIMRSLGYSEEEWPYWEREDGCKMLGDYIMVAAHLGLRPRGTIVETSLGLGIVADTGAFAEWNNTQLDIAVTW